VTAPNPLRSLVDVFSEVVDPRVARTRAHPIENVLTLALLGVISGAEGWEDLREFAKRKAPDLSQFLALSHGTPSADTFRRVFEALPPPAFHEALMRWMRPMLGNLAGQTIALDGKALRGAMAHTRQGGAFHLLHVWATEQRVLLAQAAVGGAGEEVPAALELLRSVDLTGATVTADANFCTAGITQVIRDRGGHYLLALKGNRSTLHRHVADCFATERDGDFATTKPDVQKGGAHGRSELRIVRAMSAALLPHELRERWTDLESIVQVERLRLADELSFQRSYYITSHAPQAKKLAPRVRDHWKIENELHHCLDVTFGDDRRAIRSEYGTENFALLARFALSLLKRNSGPSSTNKDKRSVRMKRKIAMWSDSYYLEVLNSGFPAI